MSTPPEATNSALATSPLSMALPNVASPPRAGRRSGDLTHRDAAAHAVILIVDDDVRNCKLLESLLQYEGYSTVRATNGAEALAMIARRAPDLILLDIMMPGMDGYQVAAKLKADPATAGIPIILVTQRLDREAHLAGLQAGAEEFLTKPVDRAELWLRVRNLLRLKAYGDFLQNHSSILEQQVQARTQSLLDTESLKSAILASSLDCIITIDHEGRIVEFNPAAENTFGIPRAQALGKAMVELIVPPRLRDAHRRGFTRYLETGEGPILGKRLELHAVRADGSEFPIELTINAIGTASRPMFTAFVRDITVRLADQARLRESEARFRSLTELSSDWFWEQDAEHRFVRFSGGEGVKGWGPDQEQAVGLHRWDLVGVIPISCGWEEHRRLLDAHESFRDFEYSRILGDGRLQYVEATGEPIFDPAGRFTGYRGVATEITDRKLAQKDMQRQQSELRALFDLMPAMIWFKDTQNGILRVNGKVAAAAGKSIADIEGKPSSEIYPHDAARFYADDLVVMQSGEAKLGYVEALQGPDGSEHWVQTDKVPYFDHDGKVIGIVVMAQDITERTRAAQELRESERRLSDMLGNIELISVMLDRDARITYCNDYFLRLTGWRREEVIGRNWFDAFMPAELGDMKPVFQALLANQPEAWHREQEIYLRSGERRLVRWNNSVLRSGAGDVVGTASIGEDITEQKRAEVRIRRLNRVYAVLSGINTLIVRAQDRDELFGEACRVAVEAGHFAKAWLGLVDPVSRQFRIAAALGGDPDFFPQLEAGLREKLLAGKGLVARALATQRPVISNDMASDPEVLLKDFAGQGGARSLAMLPLIVAGETIGVFVLNADVPDFFDEEEMKLLVEMAGDIAHAIDHIDKEAKVRRLTRVTAVLSGVNSAIVRIREREALFAEICRIAVSDGGFIVARVIELDANGTARIAATSESDARVFQVRTVDEYNSDPGLSASLLASVLRTGQAMVSNDVAVDLRIPNREALTANGNYAIALLPIVVDKRVAGAVLLRSMDLGMFDDEEMKLLLELVSNLSFALELMGKSRELAYLAYYDALTGLANRTLFLERVAQYMRSAVAGGHKLALFLVDLERFRNINDSLGRAAGDALLQQAAALLSAGIGDPGLLARVGIDQFAIVLPELKQQGSVAHLLDKRIQAFTNHPFNLNGTEYRIAVKVGVALFPNDGIDADSLLKNAEAALKNAKISGEKVLFYAQNMNEKAAGRLTLENQLRQALENGEFVLHYQPKVRLDGGELVGAEALIRWNNPRTGLVPPGQFIPVLEETGLIYDVGRWALRQAIRDYLHWHAAGLPAVRIAVNVSPMQLRNRGFIAEIEQVLGVDAGAAAGLELEITESLIMEDVKRSIESLRAIRAMGVRVAIDDFGTGYSSLSHLARLPVDTLKIDRSFVIDMTSGPDGLALVSTIINLAHSLKLNVVAEGVETEEQSRLLRLMRCDEYQGFLFSKPVPAEAFETRFLAPPASAMPP